MAILYVLKSKNHDRLYIGSSHKNDEQFRLRSHNQGKVRSTKAYRPWRVIYSEHFLTYTEARKREFFLKTGVGRQWIREKLANEGLSA